VIHPKRRHRMHKHFGRFGNVHARTVLRALQTQHAWGRSARSPAARTVPSGDTSGECMVELPEHCEGLSSRKKHIIPKRRHSIKLVEEHSH
jgi:hypothetical protein